MDTVSIPQDIGYKRVLYRKGSEILWGPDNESLFILEEGTADVIFYGDDDETMRIYRYKAPDIFGEVEVLTDRRSQLEITAVTDCVICKISRDEALRWMEKDFSFSLHIMQRLCEKLMEDTDKQLRLKFRNSRERYLESMLRHAEDGSLNELTKIQLCEELCIPLRSLNRAIAQCRDRFIFKDGHFEKTDNT